MLLLVAQECPTSNDASHRVCPLRREVRPHSFVSATAVGNRVFILTVNARSSRAWAKARDALRVVQSSFYVPPPRAAAGTA